MPRRGEHGIGGVAVEPSAADLGTQHVGGLLRRGRGTVRPWLAQGVVHVGGGEDARAGGMASPEIPDG